VSYIRKHWRGDLSLAVSFWINVFSLNIAIMLFEPLLAQNIFVKYPQVAARITIVYVTISHVLIYPWEIIGLWRTCNRHAKQAGKGFWARTAQILAVIGLLSTVGDVNKRWPLYKEMYQLGFQKDKFANYTLTIEKNGSLIHLQGGLGFGVSKDVVDLIRKNQTITGLILDSAGGRVYEGRELAKLILQHGLDTYSLKGCYSACTTAFIAGKKRYLGLGANLAFHQYHQTFGNIGVFSDIESEQGKDLRLFQQQGISNVFLERIFKTAHKDFWYPTIEELVEARIVHNIIHASDIAPVKYDSNSFAIENALQGISAFETIRRYTPNTYEKILKEFDILLKKGASQLEIESAIADYIQAIAEETMPVSSDDALIKFARATIEVLKKLGEQDPILCIKNLYPQQYGPISPREYVSEEILLSMIDALSQIIVDSYEKHNRPVDINEAELLMMKLMDVMGNKAQDLEPKDLQNRADYKRLCDATIEFYALILKEDERMAGNALRYVLNQK